MSSSQLPDEKSNSKGQKKVPWSLRKRLIERLTHWLAGLSCGKSLTRSCLVCGGYPAIRLRKWISATIPTRICGFPPSIANLRTSLMGNKTSSMSCSVQRNLSPTKSTPALQSSLGHSEWAKIRPQGRQWLRAQMRPPQIFSSQGGHWRTRLIRLCFYDITTDNWSNCLWLHNNLLYFRELPLASTNQF